MGLKVEATSLQPGQGVGIPDYSPRVTAPRHRCYSPVGCGTTVVFPSVAREVGDAPQVNHLKREEWRIGGLTANESTGTRLAISAAFHHCLELSRVGLMAMLRGFCPLCLLHFAGSWFVAPLRSPQKGTRADNALFSIQQRHYGQFDERFTLFCVFVFFL